MEHHRPRPSVEADESKSVPKDVKRRIRANFATKLLQAFVVNEKVQRGEKHGSWLLKEENPHERPLPVELRNIPLAGDERLSRFVHAPEKMFGVLVLRSNEDKTLVLVENSKNLGGVQSF